MYHTKESQVQNFWIVSFTQINNRQQVNHQLNDIHLILKIKI